MKRTNALKLIANQLDFLNYKFSGFRDDFTPEELSNADVILTTLESAGMLPPEKIVKVGEYTTEDGDKAEEFIIRYEWEEE